MKNQSLGTALASSAILCAASACSSTACAADAAGDPATSGEGQGMLQEVVVTAQKRAENLQRVPIAVTALTASDLQGGSIEGQQTLPKLTPNLNFTVVATFAAAYIRGVGTEYANPGLESSVPVYLDDAYLPRAASGSFDFNDLARIEVLKGPQGTLYGRNATGGAIRLITNDPKLGVIEGSAQATYGSFDRIKYGTVLNLPLGDKIAVRFAAQRDQNSGYITNIYPADTRKVGDRNEGMYTAKVLIDATDQLRIKVGGQYSIKRDNEGMTFQNIFTAPQQIGQAFGGCVSTNFYNLCSDNRGFGDRVAQGGVTARVDYDVGAAILSSITSYQSETENDFAEIDATGAPLQHTHGQPSTRQYTEELQVTSQGSGPLKYVGGLYYLRERSQYDYNAYGAGVDGGFAALGKALGLGSTNLDYAARGAGNKTESIAPYAQADYQVTDQFSITGGVRYTIEKKTLLSNEDGLGLVTPDGYLVTGSYVGAIQGPCHGAIGDPTAVRALCTTTDKILKFNKFTPKLTLSYTPSHEDLFYLTYARGFKSGGFNLPAFGAVDAVEPETLDDIEAGWKHESGPVRFNGAAFFYNYKNLQVQETDPATAATFNKNGANAHLYGAEGDLSYLVTERVEMGAGGGYLHATYTSFPEGSVYVANYSTPACALNPAACVGNSFPSKDLKGLELVAAPKFTGYLRGQYTQPLAGDLGKVMFSSIANYRTKAYFDIGNQLADNSRVLLSARVEWVSANDKYSVGAYGENLTGKEYYLSRTLQVTGGFQVPAAPRTGYITGSVKF